MIEEQILEHGAHCLAVTFMADGQNFLIKRWVDEPGRAPLNDRAQLDADLKK